MIQNEEYILTNETFYSTRDIMNTSLWEDARKLLVLSYEKEGRETGETEFYFSALDFKYRNKEPRKKVVKNWESKDNFERLMEVDHVR